MSCLVQVGHAKDVKQCTGRGWNSYRLGDLVDTFWKIMGDLQPGIASISDLQYAAPNWVGVFLTLQSMVQPSRWWTHAPSPPSSVPQMPVVYPVTQCHPGKENLLPVSNLQLHKAATIFYIQLTFGTLGYSS